MFDSQHQDDGKQPPMAFAFQMSSPESLTCARQVLHYCTALPYTDCQHILFVFRTGFYRVTLTGLELTVLSRLASYRAGWLHTE